MKRFGLLLIGAVALGQPQTGVSVPPAFEVASVKPSTPQSKRGSSGGPGSGDPERYIFNAASLDDLIVIAYNVQYFQISSKVPLDKQTFDLTAKLPPGTTKPQFHMMLQGLLAERFHLKAHIESKDFAAYVLVVAKNGPKLKESVAAAAANSPAVPPRFSEDGFPVLAPNRPGMAAYHRMDGGYPLVRMRAVQQPISALAKGLHAPDDAPIVDKTGLTGKYDFTFEYTEEFRGAPPESGALPAPVVDGLFTALTRQLGLQLVRQKVPFDVVVIESVDRLPVENE